MNTAFDIQDREAWLQTHRTYVGGTGAACLVGLNKWKSPHKLYLEIVHGEYDAEASIAAEMGIALEPMIRRYYEMQHGVEVKPAGLIRHPDYEFFGVNPDGFIGDDGGLEIKTYSYSTAMDWGEPGEPQNNRLSFIPDPYFVQCQVGMTITGRKWWDVIALNVANRDMRNYRLYDDPELGRVITAKVIEFWQNHVIPKVPPPLTGHATDLDYLKKQYPTDTGGLCIATPAVEKVVDRLKDAWQKKREAGREFDAAKSLIQDFMQDNSVCETMAGPITWRKTKDTEGIDYKSVAEGFFAYACLMSPDEGAQFTSEFGRLKIANTKITRKGSRTFKLPFGDED